MYPIQKRNLDNLPIWNELSQLKIQEKFKLHLSFNDIALEICHHHLNQDVLGLFAKLCEQQGFFELRKQFLENIPSLHMPKYIFQRSFSPSRDMFKMRKLVKETADKIHHHEWMGYMGNPFKDIVNIGIGGSDLGPKFYVKKESYLFFMVFALMMMFILFFRKLRSIIFN